MKVTLLLENNCLFGKYLNAEHGFSAWIEDDGFKVLYDCGYSDNFIRNAGALGIDLREADYVVLSHGHHDHTGGLKYLIKYFKDNAMAKKPILLFTHEDIFLKVFNFKKNRPSGMDVSREFVDKYFDVRVTPEPLWVTKNLCYMGMCEITNDFEHKVPQRPKKLINGEWLDDLVDEDTQFAYKHKNGEEVSVVTGCAHYGICNIMEYAKKLTGAHQINTYLGGSHLRIDEIPQSQLDKTCEYVKEQKIKNFYICHDTDLHCKLALWNATPSKEAGVGLVVEWD
ncbi:MAG: MBL fold metallo-hydrolase [Desulfobacterales bacterium]|nr:MBL fold metallo-hydrolase [Desulfobacterales bacterium]